jgi:hypothetical protein
MQGAYNLREISSAQFGSPGPPSPGSTRLLWIPSPEFNLHDSETRIERVRRLD